MNRFESITKPLIWLMTLLQFVFIAGCLTGIGNNDNSTPSSAKLVSAYSLSGNAGVVNEPTKSIAVTVPFGTPVTALVATFTTNGAGVKVGTATQTSTATANDFTSPVIYTITAADGSTVAYTVTVNIATASANAISAYSFVGYPGATGTVGKVAPYAILVVVPTGTSPAALVATFTTNAASVKVGTTTQISGTTANDFTNPVTYTVTAANGTTATYTVTVKVALATSKAISAFSFVGYPASTGTISGSSTPYTIAVSVPSGTNRAALIAKFTTSGSSVTVGSVTQVSSTTSNSFTSTVAYTAHAADASMTVYNVTVTVASAISAPMVDLLSIKTINNNFVVLSSSPTTGITDTAAQTSFITGNIGLSPRTAASIGVYCSEMTGSIYGVDAAYVGSGVTTCFLPGTTLGTANANKTLVDTAVADMLTAYTAASDPATPAAVDAAHLDVGAGTLPAGTNFTAGVYTWGSNVNVTGDITLTGGASDVWIFQMSGNLNLASGGSLGAGTHIILSGGAVASNVFWQVGGGTGATLGTYSTFNGTILAAKQVILQTGAVLHGRALAQTAVVLDASPVGP